MDKNKMLGFGLGLRPDHYTDILKSQPNVDWFEIITENFLVSGGKPLYYLDKIKERYPIVMHGVSMSIGSLDALDMKYLAKVKTLADRTQAKMVSDHLCWTGVHGKNLHDLIPLPYTDEAITHVVNRIKQIQDFLERPIMIENVSSYITYSASTYTEWDFVKAILEGSNCDLLLDVNNLYVSGYNHEFNPDLYLDALPKDRIKQIHLAGHTNCGTHIIDTHDEEIIDEVWELYSKVIQKFGQISTLIERDDNIPPLEELLRELDLARKYAGMTCEPA